LPSSGMWRCVGLVWTDVLEECIASRADFSTLKMEAICSSETSVHTRSTWRHIPEYAILQFVHVSNLAARGLFQGTVQFSHTGSEEVYKNCMSRFWWRYI
jgi:hypothetical protein